MNEEKTKEWGCAYCNCSNKTEADFCINCGKKKKVGSPFHFSFETKKQYFTR